MRDMKVKLVIVLTLLLSVAGTASIPAAPAGDDHRAPDLPSPLCDNLQVPAGNKVIFHVYALGVQVYRWNGTSWDFVEPVANLYADPNYRGKVGEHYRGPTWESNSGSNVVGKNPKSCRPELTAIAWLRLEAASTDGPGIFSDVTYIQRVNTAGGVAPTAPGLSVGDEARVPYTTEYYFYRAEN